MVAKSGDCGPQHRAGAETDPEDGAAERRGQAVEDGGDGGVVKPGEGWQGEIRLARERLRRKGDRREQGGDEQSDEVRRRGETGERRRRKGGDEKDKGFERESLASPC